jgi:parallel beta-helix repeat protein
VILDGGVYEERVVIDSSKINITLTSQSASKPTICWKDTVHIHPTSYEEAKNLIIDFHNNGALLIYKASNITIENIKIDGVSPFVFGALSVWDGRYSLQHGNSAISVKSSGNVVIRNCDIFNAYFGIYIKDDNYGGIYTNANPDDSDPWNFGGFGKNGNHLIERNRIHNNSFGIFCESMWDLGSAIRYNLFYENHHHSNEFAEEVFDLTNDGHNHRGGAFFFKDHMLSPLAIYNNTLWHNRYSFVGHWKSGIQHLLFNNIIAQPDIFATSHLSLDPNFTRRMHHSLYAVQGVKPSISSQYYYFSFTDDEFAEVITVSAANFVRIMNRMDAEKEGMNISVKLQSPDGPIDTTIFVDWAIPPGARIISSRAQTTYSDSTVRWFEMNFLSTDSSSPDFLVPDWNDPDVERLVLNQGWPVAGITDADGSS